MAAGLEAGTGLWGRQGKGPEGQASDSSRKSTAHSFHWQEETRVGSDMATKRLEVLDLATKEGRGKPLLFPFPLLWVETIAFSETTQEVTQESTRSHSGRPGWLLNMGLPAVGASTHLLPLFCGRLLVKFHRCLHDMTTLCLLKIQDGSPDVRRHPLLIPSGPPAFLAPGPASECGPWTPVPL